MALHRNDVTDVLAAMASGVMPLPPEAKHNRIDPAVEPEIQTDKQAVKIIGCRECAKPLVVTTFFAPAKGICAVCSGAVLAEGGGKASVGQPIPGQTNPAKAVNLTDALLNKEFAHAECPFGCGSMELKLISQSPDYGPRRLRGYDKNQMPVYDVQAGETVTFQCNNCRCTLNMSTQHQHEYRRMNEPRIRRGLTEAPLESILQTREPDPVAA